MRGTRGSGGTGGTVSTVGTRSTSMGAAGVLVERTFAAWSERSVSGGTADAARALVPTATVRSGATRVTAVG